MAQYLTFNFHSTGSYALLYLLIWKNVEQMGSTHVVLQWNSSNPQCKWINRPIRTLELPETGGPVGVGPWSPLCWATGPAFLLKSCFRTTALFKNFFHRKYWPIRKKIKKKRSEFSTKKFSTIIKIIYFTKTSCHFRSKCSHFFIKAFFFSRYFVSLIETLCCTTLQVYLTKAFLTS